VPTDILIVDDNPIDGELFQEALREASPGSQARWVASGEEAIRYLKQVGEFSGVGPVKLVVLDLNMPGLDGLETLERIRSSPQISRVPVLLFSSTRTAVEVDRAYALGANAFFNKPHLFERYIQKVRVMVEYWLTLAELPSPVRALREVN